MNNNVAQTSKAFRFFLNYFALSNVCVQVSAGGSGGLGQKSEEAQLPIVCRQRTAY